MVECYEWVRSMGQAREDAGGAVAGRRSGGVCGGAADRPVLAKRAADSRAGVNVRCGQRRQSGGRPARRAVPCRRARGFWEPFHRFAAPLPFPERRGRGIKHPVKPRKKNSKDNLCANQETCSRRQTYPARINKGRRELAAPPDPRLNSQPKSALKRVPGEARPVGRGFAAHPLSGDGGRRFASGGIPADGGRRLKKGLGRRVRT